jgi:ABC-type bacteriocin/lantibiotic exporter with double-glycine peptidase domain
MPERPHLYEQETKYSCVAACLRMVLSSFSLFKPEEEIREDCDCTIFGTYADNLLKAAKKYGFINSKKDYFNLDRLEEYLKKGCYPIVYIGVRAYPYSRPEEHSAVMVEIKTTDVTLFDPARGEITLSREEFEVEWSYLRYLTIIIEK